MVLCAIAVLPKHLHMCALCMAECLYTVTSIDIFDLGYLCEWKIVLILLSAHKNFVTRIACTGLFACSR